MAWYQSVRTLVAALVISSTSLGASIASAGTANVNLAQKTGGTEFVGSGFLYGFPDNGSSADYSIPDNFLTEIKFQTCRGGGSQIAPVGWALGGYDGYIGRFESALSNYRTTRKYDGSYILMASDLWGAQGGATADFPFPGDDNDWSEMEAFLEQVVKDIQDNDMLDGLILDLWNEPDLDTFWYPAWSQYVEYFVRASQFLRSKFPDLPLEGPSSAHSPSEDSAQWNEFMAALSNNDVAPDRFSWHQIGDWEREPDVTVPGLDALRAKYSLPERPIDVNEYAWPSEKNPANSVYYLAQFERHNIRALRANWGGGPTLHDYMANLVWKTDAGYYPNGEWQVYKYYGSMAGERVATSASSDLRFDVFAVMSDQLLKILAGTRTVRQPYEITITGFRELGLPENGTLQVQRYQFDWAGPDGQIGDPLDLGSTPYLYSSDELTILFDPPTNSTSFAFEIQL